jgi:phage baseplate assembly protein W
MATSAAVIYKGFSSRNWSKNKTFTLTNIDLVKQDLMNHIYTAKGERPMMPDFGTRIPMMAFEPNDTITQNIIREDLTTVFNYDPRVKVISLNIMSIPSNNMIIALADLLYVQFGVQQILNIEVPTS